MKQRRPRRVLERLLHRLGFWLVGVSMRLRDRRKRRLGYRELDPNVPRGYML